MMEENMNLLITIDRRAILKSKRIQNCKKKEQQIWLKKGAPDD